MQSYPKLPSPLVLFAALLLGGCGGTDVGFGVALTMRFDGTVSDAALATVDTLEVDTSGDESYMKTIGLDRAAMRVERTIYRPSSSTHEVDFSVIARDGHGVVVAVGASKATIKSGETTSTTLELAVPSVMTPDGSSSDGGSLDGGSMDGGLPDATVDAFVPVVPTFVAARAMNTATGPTAVAVGDLNGDNLVDIAVAATDGGKVQLFFAVAQGTFPSTPSLDITVGHPTAILVADFDGDTKNDIVVADSSTGTAIGYHGYGDGTFAAAVQLATLSGADSLAIADFDSDGTLDVAVGSSSTSQFAVAWDGIGASAKTFGTAAPLTRMYAADMNADGAMDLVGIEGNNIVSIINTQKTQPHTFNTTFTVATGGESDVAVVPAAASVAPNVLAASSSNGTCALYVNDGTGQLSVQYADIHLQVVSKNVHLAAVDLDGDGEYEIIESAAYNGSNFETLMYAWSSDNSTNSAMSSYAYATEDDPRGFAIGDLNGDGKPDVVLTNHGSSSLSIYYTTGLAATTGAPLISGSPIVGLFDYNGDGKLDLELSTGTELDLIEGYGTGMFGQAVSLATSASITAVASGDLNEDGKIDIVWTTSNGHLEYALAGTTGFGTPQSVTLNGTLVDLAFVDVTGDGHLDIIVLDSSLTATMTSRNVMVYPGNNGAAFGFAAPSPVHMKVADVNGDGALDIVVATSGGTLQTLLLTAGGTLKTTIASGSSLTSLTGLASVDANGDGKLDVVVAGAGAQLLLGKNDGTFSKGPTLSSAQVADLAIAMINRDAYPDLCLLVDGRIYILTGDGTSFQPSIDYSSGPNGTKMFMGDVTSDGLADAVVSGQTTAGLINSTK